MNIRIKSYMTLGLVLMLSGCINTMYFYETEKISLTVEARPDSSQPVQGSLGFKQRVALIVPKKSNKQSIDGSNNQTIDGEALSAMSSFNFKIKDEPGFNPILIQTAFVTGAAAEVFGNDKEKAGVVAEALAHRAQAESRIRIQNQQLGRILAYVFDGSDSINSTKLDKLITEASKEAPLALSPPVQDKIKRSKTRSELHDILFLKFDTTILPIYGALPADKR